jgi:ubiquinone/menaquinone biosynthesis C-methylase UbiE/capsular polysaccharide biosynthesis protein
MHDAAILSSAPLSKIEDVLGSDEIQRICGLWEPAEWPEATDRYTKESYRSSFESHLERVRHLGLSGGLLIDAGCGGGRWSFAWATRFARVVGFDIAPKRLATANWQKERFAASTVEFIMGDVRKIPADDESADVVYCKNVISGVIPIEPILQEFARVLKPGGICYLGMAGPGLTYERAKIANPPLAYQSRMRIYNTLCWRHLASLVGAVSPGGAWNLETAAFLQQQMSTTELLTCVKGRPDQIAVAKAIEDDLGPAFSQRLVADLAAINAGTKMRFGDRLAGRDWDVDEVSAAAREAGFRRTAWAPEAWLSLKPDGSVEKESCGEARPQSNDFEGRPRAFEMFLWKRVKEKAPKNLRRNVSSVESTGDVDGVRSPAERWRLKVGNTTYWNAKSREIQLPIVDPRPPTLIELEGAIITARTIGPRKGPRGGVVRFATGGVYDRDHHLLSEFSEREQYEAAEGRSNRIKNEYVLPEEALAGAKLLRGKYIYLGILRNHFGHFLLESLSRVWYLLKSEPDVKVIFHQYENLGNSPSFVKFVFGLLGLDLDRIVIVTHTSIVEHLIFPQSEFEIRWKAHSSYSDTFRELYHRCASRFPIGVTPRRIYLTRRQLKVKTARDYWKVTNNESKVEALFAARGFAVIAPEKLPFHEQIAIAAGAVQIAGLKGSALHMSLFCQRQDAQLIQICREQTMNQSLIDELKHMEGHQILCESVPTAKGSLVDLEIIRAAVRAM